MFFFVNKDPSEEFALLEANRPRFTLQELKQVLWERNDLKTKLWEVEEELRMFKEQYDKSFSSIISYLLMVLDKMTVMQLLKVQFH